jgi:uncharacterized protein (TIGR01732 family)
MPTITQMSNRAKIITLSLFNLAEKWADFLSQIIFHLHMISGRDIKEVKKMGNSNSGFALIVVLFILLIIVGAAFC